MLSKLGLEVRDHSGDLHVFEIYQTDAELPNEGGVYIFTKAVEHEHYVMSVSETDSFKLSQPSSDHERWAVFTHVCICREPDRKKRLLIQNFMREEYLLV